MKYMFVLYVWTQCSAISEEQNFVIDFDLSQADCVAMQESWQATIDVTMSGVLCIAQK